MAREDYYTGSTAVITGAGSGIGRALAVALAGRGADLVLSDVNAESVAATADLCRAAGARVRADVLDVTDREAVLAHARLVGAEPAGVDLLFAVAGVAHTGRVLDSDLADVDRVIDVNLRGVVNVVTAFLPALVAARRGHVVTVSSVFGLVAVPSYSAYNASKFAVRGFTESLRQEMAADGHRVAVSGVYPGGVRTSIVRNGSFAAAEDPAATITRFDRTLARTEPDRAAEIILAGVERGRRRILVGPDAVVVAVLRRLVGSAYQDLLPRLRRRSRSR